MASKRQREQQSRKPQRAARLRAANTSDRRSGSALLIVMVLMGLLSVLGVLFYTFATQERNNADNYSEGAKSDQSAVDVQLLMDFALQQVINGPDPVYKNSALWGGRHSMLSNLLGMGQYGPGDLHGYNGQGLNIQWFPVDSDNDGRPNTYILDIDIDGDGRPDIDTNGDGVVDNPALSYLLSFNDSPAANQLAEVEDFSRRFPQPDVDYTAPDHNNLFLSWEGYVTDPVSGAPVYVMIPSYHRPQLIRGAGGTLGTTSGDPWYSAAETRTQVLRAHPNHLYAWRNADPSVTPPQVTRFVTSTAEAADISSQLGVTFRAFQSRPLAGEYNPAAPGPTLPLPPHGAQGVFDPVLFPLRNSRTALTTPDHIPNNAAIRPTDYKYDIDADLDGIYDSVLMDLDFPPLEAQDGRLYVPMYAIKIVDLDGLINLNTAGNLAGVTAGLIPGSRVGLLPLVSVASQPYGWNTRLTTPAMESVSRSHQGHGPWEINPAWALTGRINRRSGTPVGDIDSSLTAAEYSDLTLSATRLLTNTPTQRPLGGGSPTATRRFEEFMETANTELTQLLIGRPKYASSTATFPTEIVPGRYGEENLLRQYLNDPANNRPPAPGYTANFASFTGDDNSDRFTGEVWFESPLATRYRSFGHPADFAGIGRFWSATNLQGLNRATAGKFGWVRYVNYSSSLYPGTPVTAPGLVAPTNYEIRWGNSTVGGFSLMQDTAAGFATPIPNALLDDPAEIVYSSSTNRTEDDLFDAEEQLALMLPSAEIRTRGIASRLVNAAPINFDGRFNLRSDAIRERFTVKSMDRKSFSTGHAVRSPVVNGVPNYGDRYWEYNFDGATPFPNNTSGYGARRFPPQFGSGPGFVARYRDFVAGSAGTLIVQDPLRPAVRTLLETQLGRVASILPQQKLSFNALVTAPYENEQLHNNNQAVDPARLVLKKLTAHPDDPGPDRVAGLTVLQANSLPAGARQREFWARKDRQRMCRDIYCLLYLLGHGNDGLNQTNNPATTQNTFTAGSDVGTVYSVTQLREMAQFAVNVVDALDGDDVVTRFEYDMNLANGWNLDDDAGTEVAGTIVSTVGDEVGNYDRTAGTGERAVVTGVERIDLAFSEVRAMRTAVLATDNPKTGWPDTAAQMYVFAELWNTSPRDVNFAPTNTLANNEEVWQLEVRQRDPTTRVIDPNSVRRLSLRQGVATSAATAGGTGRFTIASTSAPPASGLPMGVTPSALVVDATSAGSGVATVQIPNMTGSPVIELDTSAAAQSGWFRMLDNSNNVLNTPAQYWTAGGNPVLNPGRDVEFVLKRRAHPNRSPLTVPTEQDADNPYVEIELQVQPSTQFTTDLSLDSTLSDADMQAELTKPIHASVIRQQPFDRPANTAAVTSTLPATQYIRNSFGAAANSPEAADFNIVQQHLDRDFANIAEIFQVPVVASTDIARAAPFIGRTPASQYSGAGMDPALEPVPKSLAGKVIFPDWPVNLLATFRPGVSSRADASNRWHRLLEFFEVPTRINRNLATGKTPFNDPRVPGRLNVNTIRHPDVFAALLDEPSLTDVDLRNPFAPADDTTFGLAGSVPRAGAGAAIDFTENEFWNNRFRRARDFSPIDPVFGDSNLIAGAANLPLPGLPPSLASTWASDRNGTFSPFRIPTNGPFRSWGRLSRTYEFDSGSSTLIPRPSMASSLLRTGWAPSAGYVPPAPASEDRRHPFEFSSVADHQNNIVTSQIRDRLLGKISQNVSTRSHVFGVFIAVKFFQAVEDTRPPGSVGLPPGVGGSGAIRVGGPLITTGTAADQAAPEHRAFFVVDRSKVEQAFVGGGFNFRAMIDYRKILQ